MSHESNKSRASQIVKILTVACALIGAVWVVMQIVSYLYPSDFKLEAYGDAVGILSPEITRDNQEKLKRLREGFSADKLKAIAPNIQDSERINLERAFEEMIRENSPRDVVDQFKNIRSIWWFTIKNVGTKEVRDIRLELPFDGLFVATQNGQSSELTEFKKNIPVNFLRPSNAINIVVWTYSIDSSPITSLRGVDDEYFNYNFSAEGTRVTHPNGVIYIDYPLRSRSAIVHLVSSSTFSTITFSLLAITISVLIGFLVNIVVRRKLNGLAENVRPKSEQGVDESS
ncbi:MAG TPA: hypothetical protein VJS64_17885 [Pyrinomonadaceae bacterium]|nr:hypothetical protein [Pyrinomonadaceae bacterium]